ncbi:MAG: ATP-binding protein [Pyrodictiaceae archaeon]
MPSKRICGFSASSLQADNKFYEDIYMILEKYAVKLVFKCKKGKCKGELIAKDKESLNIVYTLLKNMGILVTDKCDRTSIVLPPAPQPNYMLARTRPPGLRLKNESPASSTIIFARSIDGNKVGIAVDDVWRHIGVFGATGSGKTTTTVQIITRIADQLNDIRVVVFDWHNEYSHALNKGNIEYMRYQGNELPSVPIYVNDESLEALKITLGLSELQSSILKLVIDAVMHGKVNEVYARSLGIDHIAISEIAGRYTRDTRAILDAIVTLWRSMSLDNTGLLRASSKSEIEVWAALLRRIELITATQYNKLFSLSINTIKPLIRPGIHILEVGTISNITIRKLYVMLLVYSLFSLRRQGLLEDTIIVLEEAHNLIEGENTLMANLVRESRKYKLGFIIVSQNPSMLDKRIIANLNTLIVHRLHNINDIIVVKPYITDPVLVKKLPNLEVGEAIIVTPSLVYPEVVYICTSEC